MGLALEDPPMAKEKSEKPNVEMAKIESDVMEIARLAVAMERKVKGKDEARNLSEFLSGLLRPAVIKEYARLKAQIDKG